MAKADLEELYARVNVGDTVELVGQRNEETAQLFGDGKKPATATVEQPVLMAQIEPETTVPVDEPVARIAVGGSR
jgi:hypothetical protein